MLLLDNVGGEKKKERRIAEERTIPCVSLGMGEMKCELSEWNERKGAVSNDNNGKSTAEYESKDRGRLGKTSSSTCASGKATSIMLGWLRGSPFSSREKMTW